MDWRIAKDFLEAVVDEGDARRMDPRTLQLRRQIIPSPRVPVDELEVEAVFCSSVRECASSISPRLVRHRSGGHLLDEEREGSVRVLEPQPDHTRVRAWLTRLGKHIDRESLGKRRIELACRIGELKQGEREAVEAAEESLLLCAALQCSRTSERQAERSSQPHRHAP